jgi:MEDS: MEthanogen/methylotroph, DcmR Sensory domain
MSIVAPTPWELAVENPAPGEHVVQMYRDPDCLVDVVARYCQQGLVKGEGVVVIATLEHRAAFARRLTTLGIDVAACTRRGQYVAIDAHECLDAFMIDGAPDRDRFVAGVTPHLASVRGAGYDRLRLYGEMVDVLRPTAFAAAMRLEELWHELLERERQPLLCAYQVDPLDRLDGRVLVPAIARRHSHVVPTDDAARFEKAVERAFVDVFGAEADTTMLRQLCERYRPQATTMPAAQAVLLNLDDLNPYLGDAVRVVAADHYRGGMR